MRVLEEIKALRENYKALHTATLLKDNYRIVAYRERIKALDEVLAIKWRTK